MTAIVLLVLFAFQSVAVVSEAVAQDAYAPPLADATCQHDSIGDHCDEAVFHDAAPCTEGSADCGDCEHCMGCHLTAMVCSITVYSMPGPGVSYPFLARFTITAPAPIDRPPIA